MQHILWYTNGKGIFQEGRNFNQYNIYGSIISTKLIYFTDSTVTIIFCCYVPYTFLAVPASLQVWTVVHNS